MNVYLKCRSRLSYISVNEQYFKYHLYRYNSTPVDMLSNVVREWFLPKVTHIRAALDQSIKCGKICNRKEISNAFNVYLHSKYSIFN